MDVITFERILAHHCAPALLGLKAANLISLPAETCSTLKKWAGRYNAVLRGPRFLVLGCCRERALLLVYRAELLENALRHPVAQMLLAEAGYQPRAALPRQLHHLMARLKGEGEVPHEVGLFLGYPPEDVAAFLSDPMGRGCKLCGCWKVYHDVEGAERKFQLYHLCQMWLEGKLDRGETLCSLLGRPQAA